VRYLHLLNVTSTLAYEHVCYLSKFGLYNGNMSTLSGDVCQQCASKFSAPLNTEISKMQWRLTSRILDVTFLRHYLWGRCHSNCFKLWNLDYKLMSSAFDM